MAANILLPLAANALGLKDMFVRNLPESMQGIGSFLVNPIGTIARPIFEKIVPEGANPYSNAIPSQSAFGSLAREAIADYLPKSIGDIVSPERVLASQIPYAKENLVPIGGGLYKRVFEGPEAPYTFDDIEQQQAIEELQRLEDAIRTGDLGSFEDIAAADYISEMTPEEWSAQNFPAKEAANAVNLGLGNLDIGNLGLGDINFGNLDLGSINAGNFDFGGFESFDVPDIDYGEFFAKGGEVKKSRKVVA